MNRDDAEKILKSSFGLDHFHDEQWKAISRLLNGNHRILMVERTGFGKSLCYQFPAILFSGVTIVFSPLIALMRDQVNGLMQKGIASGCINSGQTDEENASVLQRAEAGELKILYITPERQENREWMQSVISGRIRISMVVIDEAHTVSVWGHDFRPAFRKIINLVRKIGTNTPVLATTATATPLVQEDIRKQLGGTVEVIRGNLVRENFRLYVIETYSEEEKMIWLKNNLSSLHGTGIIYAGTRTQSELYATWLSYNGIPCTWYNARLDSESRKDIEKGLMENRWKCIISTNALGMGIDKPDIRFIIHLQVPVSPIHYYQEIGRAGRDGKTTYAILLYNSSRTEDGMENDMRLPLAFINGAKPDRGKYNSVVETIRASEEPLGEREIMLMCNLKQTEFRTIKEDLIEQDIIREADYGKSRKFEPVSLDKEIDFSGFDVLRKKKLSDLNSMIEYVHTKRPRMNFLCEFLGDHNSAVARNCDNTDLEKLHVIVTKNDTDAITEFRETYFPEKTIRIDKNTSFNVVAASYYGVSAVGRAIHRSKYENGGDFPDFLISLTIKAFHKRLSGKKYDLILFVPPTVSGDLVKNFAIRVGKSLNIPVSDSVRKARDTGEQKYFRNSVGKNANVRDAFRVEMTTDIKGKRILLLDDIIDSGSTLKETARLIYNKGAADISALVIAQTVGNDI